MVDLELIKEEEDTVVLALGLPMMTDSERGTDGMGLTLGSVGKPSRLQALAGHASMADAIAIMSGGLCGDVYRAAHKAPLICRGCHLGLPCFVGHRLTGFTDQLDQERVALQSKKVAADL
jgi:hypothetical protein